MEPLRDYGWHFGIALAASLGLTVAVRTLARRFGWVAKPRPDRWHQKPTALFGGVGIFGGFLLAYLVRRPAGLTGGGLLTACASGMFLLGFIDDKFQLKPYAKLVGQIAFATLFTTFGLRLHWLLNPILDQGLTIFWLVGMTNALNLLDNIDGAAGGVAAIAGGFLIYFCHMAGQGDSAMIAAAFTGAVLGFLVFNFNPASIFMGDCGSLFIGFFLGGLSLVNFEIGARRNVIAVLAIPVLLLLLPILDTTLVTITRRYHGRRVSQGGRDHTSHRLVALGMSERRATLTLWAISAISGGLAVAVKNVSAMMAIGLMSAFVFGLLFLMIFLGRVKVYQQVASEVEANGRTLLPTLADFSYKRRVFETLNDLVLIMLCYYGAFLLRFDESTIMEHWPQFVRSLPLVIVSQLSVFLVLGLYRGVWRYTGMDDLAVIVRAVAGAVLLSTGVLLVVFGAERVHPRVVVINALLLLLGVGGSRVSFRFLRSWLGQKRAEGRRVIIYGAGDGGELLVRELQNNLDLGLVPVGFVDDDPQKAGRMIHGVRVMGSSDGIDRILASVRAHEVVLSSSKIGPERWERVERACTELGLGARRMRIALE
ncbi:MAG: hypothetical protein EXR72_03005 [Myxococcales bacterium]|nr:hypothetical protein [Myxococcales bacterium]